MTSKHQLLYCAHTCFSLPRYLSFDPNGGQALPNSPTTWTYKARWHDCFAMLESSLPNLMHLCINQNPLSWKGASHSSLSAALDVRRYYVFRWNGTTGTDQWAAPGCFSTDRALPSPPDCLDEDQRALDKLLTTIDNRK